jgi:hypothetical protein
MARNIRCMWKVAAPLIAAAASVYTYAYVKESM